MNQTLRPQNNGRGVPEDILKNYYQWLALNPDALNVQPEQFASIYRFGMSTCLRTTSSMSPQFEALRRLVEFVDGNSDHHECLAAIAALYAEIGERKPSLTT